MPSFQSTCFNSGNTCRRARSGPELQECVKLGVFRGSSSGRCCSHARLGVRATHRFISVVAGTAHRFMKRHRPWGDWCLSGDKPRGVVLFEKKMFRAVAVNYDVPPSGCRVTVSSTEACHSSCKCHVGRDIALAVFGVAHACKVFGPGAYEPYPSEVPTPWLPPRGYHPSGRACVQQCAPPPPRNHAPPAHGHTHRASPCD